MNTTHLVNNIRARFQHHEAKLYLEEKYLSQLTIVSHNGIWTITPELIAYLQKAPTETILIDNNTRPIKVNSSELLAEFTDVYNNVMNSWYEEYSELEKRR